MTAKPTSWGQRKPKGFRYGEATVVSRDNRGTYIEWHDGSRERLKNGIDWPLNTVSAGRQVGMWVKLGDRGKTVELWPEITLI